VPLTWVGKFTRYENAAPSQGGYQGY